MDFAQFQEAANALAYVPPSQRERAIAIAKDLTPELQQEFLRHLQELNEQLRVSEEAQSKFLSGMETIVITAEKGIKRLEREEEESPSHQEELRSAEENLSFPSAA